MLWIAVHNIGEKKYLKAVSHYEAYEMCLELYD